MVLGLGILACGAWLMPEWALTYSRKGGYLLARSIPITIILLLATAAFLYLLGKIAFFDDVIAYAKDGRLWYASPFYTMNIAVADIVEVEKAGRGRVMIRRTKGWPWTLPAWATQSSADEIVFTLRKLIKDSTASNF